MKQITVPLYEFNELSEKAQERAMQDYSAHDGYMLAADALKSISALAEHFGGKVRDYSLDWPPKLTPSPSP